MTLLTCKVRETMPSNSENKDSEDIGEEGETEKDKNSANEERRDSEQEEFNNAVEDAEALLSEFPTSISETFILNPAADMRKMRRIIAEDPHWSLATVPLLEELCISHIVDNFENNSIYFKSLRPAHKAKVLETLSVNLPLKITAELIEEECYWERCCRNRWALCNVADYGNNWKRMYFERNLEHIIEFFVPDKTDIRELNETLKVSSNFIKRLDIGQLLPPLTPDEKSMDFLEEGSDSTSEKERECDHFNMYPVLKALTSLEELHLTYSVRDCGMNFTWSMFHFTKKDCQTLSEAIQHCKTLRVLHLHRSKIDDEKTRMLMYHLLDHPSMEEIDLSHNYIGDRGAKAIGKLITSCDRILKLTLCNNRIGIIGGQALAHALIKTHKLMLLNLRLNRIGDEGGHCIFKALTKNTSLQELNVAANKMGESTAIALSQVLRTNINLVSIDISCNDLKEDGGKLIRESLEVNTTVRHLDLRLTNCGQEAEFRINQILDHNQEANRERLLEEMRH
ncbi:dynein regulatory complex subunit 5-like isoform X1 [Octopus sinensis]|uniref:Dynein regulatory complex subunit 5-like isoform X1 n=2 Tax=Octopus sinensis TaxID=2607531 RepID=A0A7E6EJW4_9MOLL|nr:dynein regulatory complex subunit 5-like isoform X1 [Octopus sinensis]